MTTETSAKFMMIVAITFLIYSLLWALAPYPSINLPARLILDIADWPVDDFREPLDRNTRWLSAIGAGVLAAISVFLGGVVVPAIKRSDSSVIRTTIFAMGLWYIIDSAGSIAAGVASNVLFNSVYLALVLIPLINCHSANKTA